MNRTALLEFILETERLSTSAAVAALHMQKSLKYEDQQHSQILWKQIKIYDKIADKIIDTIIKEA